MCKSQDLKGDLLSVLVLIAENLSRVSKRVTSIRKLKLCCLSFASSCRRFSLFVAPIESDMSQRIGRAH